MKHENNSKQKPSKRRLNGTVVSDRMAKTVVVRIDSVRKHPKYHLRFTVSKHYKAHDEHKRYHVGDVVIIEECRPLSRGKRWRVVGAMSGTGGKP